MNPYLVLRVSPDADDRQIRQAYLDGVRAHPPDTHPEQFQALNAAYEKIKDETSRLNYRLFNRDCPGDSPVDVLLRYARFRPSTQPLSLETMKTFLRACSAI